MANLEALILDLTRAAHRYWVKDWMNQLLVTDIDYVKASSSRIKDTN